MIHPRLHRLYRRLLALVALAVAVSFIAGAAVVARNAYEYFRQPSDGELRAALTQQFPYRDARLDRRTARVDEIDVVRYGAMSLLRISDPKMWVWVRAHDAHGRRAAGLAYMDVVDSDAPVKHPAIIAFDPKNSLRHSAVLQDGYFSPDEVAHIRGLLVQ